MKEFRLTVDDPDYDGERIDRFVAEHAPVVLTRSQLKSRDVHIIQNGRPVKLSRHVALGDKLVVRYTEPPQPDVSPEPVRLPLLYEDDDVVVIDKPQGMVVHPARGNYSGTLVQGLLYRFAAMRDGFGDTELRPGIVHRLDKETSGVLIAAKHPAAQEHLAEQFRCRRVKKTYLAILKGVPPKRDGTVETLHGRDPHHRKRFTWKVERGKDARTEYRVLAAYGGYSFVSLQPLTGRTHQLRVHMLSLGCPVLGDPVYARSDSRFPDATLMLHAYRLSIALPGTAVPRRFRAPVPSRLKQVLLRLAERR
jgi:23S rRNA pseudouridine1911/1915/1917 synthase